VRARVGIFKWGSEDDIEDFKEKGRSERTKTMGI
jgi:hypothetical protein